jgi:hypothetical protein
VRPINDAHPPLANLFQDAVVAEYLANDCGRGGHLREW